MNLIFVIVLVSLAVVAVAVTADVSIATNDEKSRRVIIPKSVWVIAVNLQSFPPEHVASHRRTRK